MKLNYSFLIVICAVQISMAQLQSFRPTTDDSGLFFGKAIDVDGNEIIVSSGTSMMNINGIGKVYLFAKNNNSIEQQQVLFANGVIGSDNFGYSISIHNNFIAISASGDDTTASNAGAVYLYQKVNGTYAFLQKIIAPDGMINDYFGNCVKLYNNQLFIAANGVGLDASFGSGAVYNYTFNGTSWVFVERLTIPDTNALGRKIVVENETLVIASDDGNQSIHTYHWDSTHWVFSNTMLEQSPWEGMTNFTLANSQLFILKVYELPPQGVSVFNNSNGSWVYATSFDLIDNSDQIFTEINVNGDDIFLGSNQYMLQQTRKFPVLRYHNNGGNWQYQTTYYGEGQGGLDDLFGSCIASKGNIVIIGAPFDGLPPNPGNAYYLDMTLGNSFFEKKSSTVYPNPTHDMVHIETDDSSVIIGVKVYTVTGNLIYSQTQNTSVVSLENVAQGIYFMKVNFQNNTEETFKIIKN